jgi:hypothetical protein
LLVVFRQCESSDLSAEAQRAKAEANPFLPNKSWIASSRNLPSLRSSRGAHSRGPLDPLRKRFAFVAGNDGL